MQKAEPQQKPIQNQSAQRQGHGVSLESPQGERIAQLEAMAASSSQTGRLAQLAGMANTSPRMAAQRKAIRAIHNSPNVTAQRQQIDSLTGGTAQRKEAEEPLQAKVAQREAAPVKPNNTGLPDNLKSGIENLSGMSMDNVKVHYNSSQPAQLNALAYAQGADIHVAPGQEQHLPHEAWHVVQQVQGRVQPTMQMKEGVPVNDDAGLEREADVMGAKAVSVGAVQAKRSIESAPIDAKLDLINTPARNHDYNLQLFHNNTHAPVVQRIGPSYIPKEDGPNAFIDQAPATAGVVSFDNVADAFYAGLPSEHVSEIEIIGGIDTYANDAGGGDVVRTGDVNPVIGQIDHIVPRSRGGGTSFRNAQLVDAPTNNAKNDAYPCPISNLNGTRVFLGTSKWNMPAGTILATDFASQRIQILENARVPKNLGVTLYETAGAGQGTQITAETQTAARNHYVPENDTELQWLSYDEARANGLAPGEGGPLA
ncbi:MAG TPA: DUF4157 domain-containing protein [Gallionella sp.]|nr:DUF4157 domain-containing protein [Gallionella sp.]